jgi:hypothetical protein
MIGHPGARPPLELAGPAGPGAIAERLHELGFTDGLPVVAPTPELVTAMLAAGPWDPAEVLIEEPTRNIEVTAYLAAVNAVLAGARPDYFPVIGAALVAMGDPAFKLHLPTASTGGATIMVIVTGPMAEAIGIQSRENLFGPGFRANATIGRTVRLVQMNTLLAVPGDLDRSTQGWPGKFSLCFGEDESSSPWEPLHRRLGRAPGRSAVTVFAAESGHNVCNHGTADPEALLTTFADTMAALGSFSNGRSVVVFAPEHARKLGDAGWSAERVRGFLYDNARRDLATLKRSGKIEDDPEAVDDWSGRWRPAGDQVVRPGDEAVWVRRGHGPEDILVLVGGGQAGGHSMFFPSWSRSRGCPFVTVDIPEADT